MTELADGRLLSVWYSGSVEGAPDVALMAATWDRTGWSAPEVLLDTPGLSDGNPVLWTAPDGAVWLFHVVIHGSGWESVLPYYRILPPDGNLGAARLAESRLFADRRGLMFRCRPVVLRSGRIVLPAYDERDWTGVCYLSDDHGKTWRPSDSISAPTGCIQPAVVERRDGSLCAYLRTGGPGGCIWQSTSKDGGETWSECRETRFPNPNSGLDLIRCHDGRWVLACNPLTHGRGKLSVAVSADEGQSWSETVLEEEAGQEFSYPALLQAHDGHVHLLYTYKRQSIKHVAWGQSVIR